MKAVIGFIAGVMVCALAFIGINSVLPINADSNTEGDSEEPNSSLVNIVPDIEKIYRQALIQPFLQAESQIYDEDIKEFYRNLLEATGLTEENLEPQR